MDDIAQQLAMRVSQQLPGILDQLLREGYEHGSEPWQLECSLTTADETFRMAAPRFPIAAVNIGGDLSRLSPTATPFNSGRRVSNDVRDVTTRLERALPASPLGSASGSSTGNATPVNALAQGGAGPAKRRRTLTQRPTTVPFIPPDSSTDSMEITQQLDGDGAIAAKRKKRTSENPVHQPSTLEKYISGVWESLYSGPKIDISEVVGQWQAIEADGQPQLLTDFEQEAATQSATGVCKCDSIPTRHAFVFAMHSPLVYRLCSPLRRDHVNNSDCSILCSRASTHTSHADQPLQSDESASLRARSAKRLATVDHSRSLFKPIGCSVLRIALANWQRT